MNIHSMSQANTGRDITNNRSVAHKKSDAAQIDTTEKFEKSSSQNSKTGISPDFIKSVKTSPQDLNDQKPASPGSFNLASGSVTSGLSGSPGAGASMSLISKYTTQKEHDIMVELAGGEQNIPKSDVINIVNGKPQKSIFVDWKDIYNNKREHRKQKYGKHVGAFLNALNKSGDKDKSVTSAMLATSANKWSAIEKGERDSIEDAVKQIMNNSGLSSSSIPRETKKEKEKRIRAEVEKFVKKNPNDQLKITYGKGFINIGGVKVPINK